MTKKSRVFVITPFDEDYLALYDELKKSLKKNSTLQMQEI